MQILVVEDEVGLAHHISRALTPASHELTIVHDGETALGEAEVNHYDLIVLDVMLPGMDGFEVLRRLRASENRHSCPYLDRPGRGERSGNWPWTGRG